MRLYRTVVIKKTQNKQVVFSNEENLPCVIVDVNYDKYQLACQWGILEDLYGAQHLEMYHGLIEFDSKIIENPISLRSAAIAIIFLFE